MDADSLIWMISPYLVQVSCAMRDGIC